MFGYVNVNIPELKVKDYLTYRSYYCGLCQTLKKQNGAASRVTLSYDMTFLAILLTGLYEPECHIYEKRCMMHPMRKQTVCVNEVTKYAADMNLLLNYDKMLDDWKDERKISRYFYSLLIKRRAKKVMQKYPEKASCIQSKLQELSDVEEAGVQDFDTAAGLFGKITEEIFAYRKDEWEGDLRQMGFYLGKFIYLMDAYEDLEHDRKKDSYNPFRFHEKEENFEENSRQMLTMMMAECARAFERLPIVKEVDILRNILYSGIWTKFEEKNKARDEVTHK